MLLAYVSKMPLKFYWSILFFFFCLCWLVYKCTTIFQFVLANEVNCRSIFLNQHTAAYIWGISSAALFICVQWMIHFPQSVALKKSKLPKVYLICMSRLLTIYKQNKMVGLENIACLLFCYISIVINPENWTKLLLSFIIWYHIYIFWHGLKKMFKKLNKKVIDFFKCI